MLKYCTFKPSYKIVCIYLKLRYFYFSAGGLVTAVAPVVVQGNGLWIGWPGVHLEEGVKIPESDPNDTTPTAGLRSDKVGHLV